MHGVSGGPGWAALPPDSGSMSCVVEYRAVGEAICRAWRAALKTFQPETLKVDEKIGTSLRQAALLVRWLATHPPVQLRHLWLPNTCPTQAALEVAIRALPQGELRSVRMTEHHNRFWFMEKQLPVFTGLTGLTSMHFTLQSNFRASDSVLLRKLSATLQDLYLASPQGSCEPDPPFHHPLKRPNLELLVPLPHLTRLGLGRPFRTVTLDFGHMPQLQRLELRTFNSIAGAATLSQCTQLSELEVFGSVAKKVLPAAANASLRHLMLHYAPGAEKHCPAALAALTVLRCLALRGKHSSKLLPAEPLPALQALFLDDKNIHELFYGPAKLFSQLRVLHLSRARANDLMDCAIYPGIVQIEKLRADSLAGSIRGFAVRYSWFEAMLRPGLPGMERCLVCPLESGGVAPQITPQHLQSQLHLQQLERFRQYAKDYKEEVASPLALWHTICQEVQRLAAELPAAAPSLTRVQERLGLHGQNVMARMAAVEGSRSWNLAPSLQAASVLMGQITSAALLLEVLWPKLGLKTLTGTADTKWAAALTEAEAIESSLRVLAKQPVPGARLPERLVELGIKATKPHRYAMSAVAVQSGAPHPEQRAAERAATAVEGWVPAGASVRPASIEGWIRVTRALGL